MIHVAIGIFVASLTLVGLVLVSFVVPEAPSVDASFITGAVLAVVISAVLVAFVRWQRM